MKKHIFTILILSAAIVGASALSAYLPKGKQQSELELESQEVVVEEVDESVPSRVPVLEYHNFGEIESRWTRSYENFRSDLEWLYNNNYRPVTVAQFLKMEFPIEAGMKPVLLTFDDASEHQFRYLTDDTIDPRSAIGVMDEFVKEHPDFGTAATFFVLPFSFGQADRVDKKLEYLVRTGREIGNHTYGHEDLSELDAETIQWSLAMQEMYVQEQLGDDEYQVLSLAYPLGHYPDGDLFEYVKNGESEEHSYEINAAFLVGSNPTLMPDHPDFDPYRVPRIQAIDDEWERWFNRLSGETEKVDEAPEFRPYVVVTGSVAVTESVQLTESLEQFEQLSEPEADNEIFEIVVEEDMSSEEVVEVAPEEPKYPYQTCKEFEIDRTSNGKIFWKWAANKAKTFELNTNPDLKFKDGKFYYIITGEEESSIAEKFFANSRHYRVNDFKSAIVAANPESDFEAEDEIVIPDIPKFFINMPVSEENLWGIYLTGYYAVSDEGQRIVNQLKERGGRLVVFDVKEIDGYVFFPTDVQMVKDTDAEHIIIPNLKNYVRYWHEQDIYLAARMVIFKDINLARSRPDLAIQNSAGAPWQNREGSVWVDPSQPETQDYILDLVEDLAKSGVDEIQFDYIRFPTLGPVESTKYNFDEANTEKYEVIRDFIARVHDRLRPYDSKLSLDVYGVITWNDGYDSRSTGQRMECLGPYIDVVYPMVYPSHFGPGFAGYDNPGDAPYYFVAESIKLFKHYLDGTNTKIRPWLQAFAWRVSNYGWWYVEEQVKAANDEGVYEYSLWNASNNYF